MLSPAALREVVTEPPPPSAPAHTCGALPSFTYSSYNTFLSDVLSKAVDSDSGAGLSLYSLLDQDQSVPYIDDEEPCEDGNAGESSSSSTASSKTDQVLEAMRGFTSAQSQMMQAIQEAKLAADNTTRQKLSPMRYSRRYRCNSFSSITSGESLPSLASLDKFLAAGAVSSRCTSTVSSLPSSICSTRNPSPVKFDRIAVTHIGELTPINKEIDHSLDTPQLTEGPNEEFDSYLEDNIESCSSDIIRRQSDSTEDSSLYSSHSVKEVSTDTTVQMRSKNEGDLTPKRPWSFDISFLNNTGNWTENKIYSYKPKRLSNVDLLVQNAKSALQEYKPPRPNTLDLKYKNYVDNNLLLLNDISDGVDLTSHSQVVQNREPLSLPSEVSTNTASCDNKLNIFCSIDSERCETFDKSCNEPATSTRDSSSCAQFDIPILVTGADDCAASETTSCDYESVDENNDYLTVKVISDSSGSGEGGRTWHDLSTSPSDIEDGTKVQVLTPLSSPNSPIAAELPKVAPKIDITALKGEIMALKKDIFARKGQVISADSKDKAADKNYVSSVEDISSLKNEITALKKDFLSLLDDNAKFNLKEACKKKPNKKLKYTGKAFSIDSVDTMFSPKPLCVDRISSVDNISLSEDDDLLISNKRSKWTFEYDDQQYQQESSQEISPTDVWFQSPNVILSKGYIAKSKLNCLEYSSNSLPTPTSVSPTLSSLPLRQHVPYAALMRAAAPTNELFLPETLRYYRDHKTNNSTDGPPSSAVSCSEDSTPNSSREQSTAGSSEEEDSDDETELPCSVERVLYGLQASPFSHPRVR